MDTEEKLIFMDQKHDCLDTEEKLIFMVQKHDCLYNLQSKYYADKNAKHNAWLRISAEMKIPAPECQKLWKNIRDGYRKSLKIKQKRKGVSSRRKDRPIKFEKELGFIKPFLQNTPRLPKVLASLEEAEQNTSPQHEAFYRAPTSEPSSTMSTLLTSLKRDDDPTMSFFFTMGQTVQRMPAKTQAEIKREIFRIVNEAEFKLSDVSGYSLPSTSASGHQRSTNSNELTVPTTGRQLIYNETENGYLIESTASSLNLPPAYIIHPVPRTEFCADVPTVKSENETIKNEYDAYVTNS